MLHILKSGSNFFSDCKKNIEIFGRYTKTNYLCKQFGEEILGLMMHKLIISHLPKRRRKSVLE